MVSRLAMADRQLAEERKRLAKRSAEGTWEGAMSDANPKKDDREIQHESFYMKISCLTQRVEELERLVDMLLAGHGLEGLKLVRPKPE